VHFGCVCIGVEVRISGGPFLDLSVTRVTYLAKHIGKRDKGMTCDFMLVLNLVEPGSIRINKSVTGTGLL